MSTTRTPVRRFNGASMRALRLALGIPVNRLAADLGVTSSYVTNIEFGRRQPSSEVAVRIAERLGVPLDAVAGPGAVRRTILVLDDDVSA